VFTELGLKERMKTPFDQFQQVLIDGDVYMTIRKAAEIDVWFGSVITELMDMVGRIEDSHQTGQVRLGSFLLVNFATWLVSDPKHWKAGADLLFFCGKTGREIFRTVNFHLICVNEIFEC
jgi:hypothetical protein